MAVKITAIYKHIGMEICSQVYRPAMISQLSEKTIAIRNTL